MKTKIEIFPYFRKKMKIKKPGPGRMCCHSAFRSPFYQFIGLHGSSGLQPAYINPGPEARNINGCKLFIDSLFQLPHACKSNDGKADPAPVWWQCNRQPAGGRVWVQPALRFHLMLLHRHITGRHHLHSGVAPCGIADDGSISLGFQNMAYLKVKK